MTFTFGIVIAMIASFSLGLFFGWYLSLPDPDAKKNKRKIAK